MKTIGYAARSPETPLAPLAFQRRALRSNDVAIEILYCGVCHSDLHMARNDWNWTTYPIVPGHEIIGRVSAVGSDVTRHRVGDHVAVGCMVDSCQTCDQCRNGEEQLCREGNTLTYGSPDRITGEITQGGYSRHLVVRQEFVLRVPAGLDLSRAAPLLCAGITTYSPLRTWNVGPRSVPAFNTFNGGQAPSSIGKRELESRLEPVIGTLFWQRNDIEWDTDQSWAVTASQKSNDTLHVHLDLEAPVDGPNPEVDVDFDVTLSFAPTANPSVWKLVFDTHDLTASVDFAWWVELLSGLLDPICAPTVACRARSTRCRGPRRPRPRSDVVAPSRVPQDRRRSGARPSQAGRRPPSSSASSALAPIRSGVSNPSVNHP